MDVARIVVTGATGFVGGRVAARLRARGDEVTAIVRREDEGLAAAGIRQRLAALTEPDELRSALEDDAGPVDAIVHAAATAGPDLEEVRRVNRDGTRAVVDAARSAGVRRLVHVSTTSVYDLDALGDVEVDEDAPLVTPSSWPADEGVVPYALTKAEAEAEVLEAMADGFSVQILRPPAVLGAGRTSTWGTRVPRRYRDGELPARPPATTFGYVHVEDLVDAILASADRTSERTCNVVGGHTTFGDYLAALRRFLPGPPATPAVSPDEPWRGRYATGRLESALGVHPSRSFDDAMAEIEASWSEGDPETT
jgi:nucleoside-diphosphate-sugar epimerase